MVHGKRSVDKLDLDGNYIETFESLISAANSLGKDSGSNITGCITGRKKSAYGFKWRYTVQEIVYRVHEVHCPTCLCGYINIS